MVKKNLNNFNTQTDFHNYSTRNNYKLVVPKVRLTKTRNYVNTMAVNLFNKLPPQSHSVSDNRFKSTINSWLVRNPFYKINEFLDANVDIEF